MKFEIRDVDLYYSSNQTLRRINMDIGEEEVAALTEPLDCGESASLRVLDHLHDLSPNVRVEGDVKLDSKDIFAEMDPIEVRRRVGMVFQSLNPFTKSIYNNIAYGLKLAGTKSKTELDDRVKKVLEDAALWDGVKDRLNSSALGMSGKQQQRPCTAKTLAPGSEVPFMDEPTSALDPISTSKTEDPYYSLKQHYIIVIVTYSIRRTLRASNKTAFFLLEEVIGVSETQELSSNPKEAQTPEYVTGKFG